METPMWYFTKALSHRQKVLRLYKRALRECDNWYLPDVLEARYHKCIVRARFDAVKDEQDARIYRKLLVDGVRELWEKRHFQPYFAPHSEAGNASNRYVEPYDYHLDTWAYFERDQYPKYYARREKRKEEVYEQWEKIQDAWPKLPKVPQKTAK